MKENEKVWSIKPCPACEGKGKINNHFCPLCHGEKVMLFRWYSDPDVNKIFPTGTLLDYATTMIRETIKNQGHPDQTFFDLVIL